MTGSSIRLELKGTTLGAAFQKLARVGGEPRALLAPIGHALVEETHERFRAARDPEGNPWAPLLPAYAAIKKGPGILRGRSLRLMDSINYRVEGASVRVGSNVVYAAAHQFGAVIRPVSAPALAFFLGAVTMGPRGGKKTSRFLVLAQKVTIPARPYLGFGRAEHLAVSGILTRALAEALNARKSAGAVSPSSPRLLNGLL